MTTRYKLLAAGVGVGMGEGDERRCVGSVRWALGTQESLRTPFPCAG